MNDGRRKLHELEGFWDNDMSIEVLVSGLPRRTHIRPREFGEASYLVRQLGRAVAEMSEEQRWLGRTTESYVSAARLFARFLAERPQANKFKLSSPTSDLADALDEWERAISRPNGAGPRRSVNCLCRLLLYIDREFVQLGAVTRRRALAGSSLITRRPTPLLEYSNAERILLRDEARRVVRTVESRLRIGRKLLQEGQDPRSHGWNDVPNLLWLLSRGELTWPLFSAHVQASELRWPAGSEYSNGPFSNLRAFRNLLKLLGPTQQEAIAFEILLLQETVWAPEELHGLLLGDLEDTGAGRRYLKRKPRAQKVSYQEFADSPSVWSVNALMDRWMEASKLIRPLLRPGAPSHLLIVIRPQSNPEGWLVDRRQQAGYTLSTWISERGLTISKPHEMRRIRKTGKVVQALRAGTLAGAAGDDHTVQVFTNHYLPTTTINVIAPRVLARATERIMDRAQEFTSAGPAVVQAAASDVVEDALYSSEVRKAGEDEILSSEVDQKLLPVSCKNITASPWAGPGTLCPERVRMCFSCSNSVVFQEHLPRVQSFRDRLEVLRAELPPPQFLEHYGQTYVNVLAVQSAFPPEVIDQAREKAKSLGLNFPMSMRINYGS